MERWLPVIGREGAYEVSDLGRVRSVGRYVTYRDGRRRWYPAQNLVPCRGDQFGHLRVNLGVNAAGVTLHRYVHHLVLEAFVGFAPKGMEACHNNGNPTDNSLSNLRWDSRSGNSRDASAHGTHYSTRKTACPRGHLLVTPNLVASMALRGRRNCLACARARAHRQGHPDADFQAVSDRYYAAIMEAAA